MIGSFLEEHIIFPAGQHKIILWNRLTIINICLLWTTSKQCSFSSSVCKKNKTVTLHSPLKQEVEFALCFPIQTNNAFFRPNRKMNSISFVFFITTSRTWSRCKVLNSLFVSAFNTCLLARTQVQLCAYFSFSSRNW